jgi:hypothetical protein
MTPLVLNDVLLDNYDWWYEEYHSLYSNFSSHPSFHEEQDTWFGQNCYTWHLFSVLVIQWRLKEYQDPNNWGNWLILSLVIPWQHSILITVEQFCRDWTWFWRHHCRWLHKSRCCVRSRNNAFDLVDCKEVCNTVKRRIYQSARHKEIYQWMIHVIIQWKI